MQPFCRWSVLLDEAISGRDVPQPIVESCSFLGVFADMLRNVAPSKPSFRSARYGHLVSLRSCLTSFACGHCNGSASRAAVADRYSQARINVLGFGTAALSPQRATF